MNSKIYIIGATGFIGCYLNEHIKDKLPIVTIGRKSCDIQFDLSSDSSEMIAALFNAGDYLIFLAAISSPDTCRDQRDRAQRVNVSATIELIRGATLRGVRVIFASSDAVFDGGDRLFNDEDTQCPSSAYGEMKAAVELYFESNPLVKIIRFSYVIGPGDSFTNLLNASSKDGTCVEIFRGFKRSVVSVYDVIEGIWCLLLRWEELKFSVINFSGPEVVSREVIASHFCEYILSDLDYRVVDAPFGFWDSRSQVISTGCANFTSLLGRRPLGISDVVTNWKREL